MKRLVTFSLLITFLLFWSGMGFAKLPTTPRYNPPPEVQNRGRRILGEPDLKASITWRFVRWKGPYQDEALVEIIGTAENTSGLAIRNCWGAPGAHLIKRLVGVRRPKYLASQTLPNPIPARYKIILKKQVTVHLDNEFPSTFEMVIDSDPDVGCSEKTWDNNIAKLQERKIINTLKLMQRYQRRTPPNPNTPPHRPIHPPIR